MTFTPPPPNCPLCPRLAAFRAANAAQFPQFFNGAVPPFGDLSAQMLVVGLAPGLKGANATGRPFTGDFAGEVLYAGLKKHGFASGNYDPKKFMATRLRHVSPHRGEKERGADSECSLSMSSPPRNKCEVSSNLPPMGGGIGDSFTLHNVRVTNAVRCVPPENKPTPAEEKTCSPFLISEIAAMPNLKLILSLGLTSHQAVLRIFKLKVKDYKFAHGAVYVIPPPSGGRLGGGPIQSSHFQGSPPPNLPPMGGGVLLLDSYHTSRYNVSTGRLTQAMFDAIIAQAREILN